MSAPTELSHAARLVFDFDRERFATALFAPLARREALMALYAFNVEISRVQESVREPMAGLIRLRWWRDALIAGAGGGAVDRHPVAGPLGEVIRQYGLTLDRFEDLIAAREEDLDGGHPAGRAEAETYAERSSAALGALALAVLGAEAEASRAAARHVGIAWGLVGALRVLPHHLSMGKLTLPADLLAQAGTNPEAARSGQSPRGALARVAADMGALAASHLAQARRYKPERAALPVLLPAILADGHLATLKRAGWDPFDSRVARPRPRPLRLLFSHMLGRF